jgi:beta-N-acetylhexosaminidase
VTLDRLAAACLLPGFAGLEPPAELLRWIERGLGGVVLFGRNIRDAQQVAALTARLRAERADLVIATDEEGGDVTRLEATTGSSYPGNLALGVVDDVELTRRVAASIAADLAAAGVNLNFAPVADVNTNPGNPVIGVRSFGAEPELVARHVAAFVEGMQGAGVSACAKHFPGHGDTSTDSHLELPVAGGDLAAHLLPFRAAVQAGVEAVMTAHVVVPELDADPATLSAAALRLLRDELGFSGLVVSDALEMRAVAGTVGPEEAAVRALAAGVDALCLGHDLELEPVHAAVVAAVESGRLSRERLADAAGRVGRSRSPLAGERDPDVGRVAAARALRIEGDVRIDAAPHVIELVPTANIAAGERSGGLGQILRAHWADAEIVRLGADGEAPPLDERPIVLVLRDAARHSWQQAIAREVVSRSGAAIVVETGLPGWAPEGSRGVVETYGAGRANLEAAAAALAGR